jgi:hypothetical protein
VRVEDGETAVVRMRVAGRGAKAGEGKACGGAAEGGWGAARGSFWWPRGGISWAGVGIELGIRRVLVRMQNKRESKDGKWVVREERQIKGGLGDITASV